MSECRECFGLGWRQNLDLSVDDSHVYLERCPECLDEPITLWLVENSWDHGLAGNDQAWAGAEEMLEALTRCYADHDTDISRALNMVLVDALQRVRVEQRYARMMLEMRGVYAKYRAGRDSA